MPTAVLTETKSSQVAHDLLDYLRRLGDISPERAELLAAGVSPRRIDALYPFEFDEVAPVLTQLIKLSGLRHLKKQQADTSFYSSTVQAPLFQPQLFGITGEQQALLREICNNRVAEGTAAQQQLFDVLHNALPNRKWRDLSPALMHSIWVSCWMMANKPHLGAGGFSKFVEPDFMALMELLFPNIDLALDCLVAERVQLPKQAFTSRLRTLVGGVIK